ncbi:class I SAM-dependent methyltransferase [Leptospira selangorensis]|uniref:Class I SAM-dependent methyltransferase n=1 Tax=Leptospira selangorensis TaxID=2484982 RepID=A0ABY2N8Z4_9LEPT|nr:class I SAM-dependent methyltransferase [Leptospira selangorensis]TGM18798.1 class I SAM-dependent methyltransferase [Leptospira selangorensis]
MTPFPFSKSPVKELPQCPPYFVSNFGHWNGVSNYQEAGVQFLVEFAKHCDLQKGASILEVGSGLGGSLVYWKHHFAPKKLSAINLAGEQSNFAKHLFIENHIDVNPFLEGGWEQIQKLPPNAYDYVFAVDSAYHFTPVIEFYKQAYRVLKPGGKLVLNLFQSEKQIKHAFSFILNLFYIPPNQITTVEHTKSELKEIGFSIECELDWTNPVIEGFIQNSKNLKFSLHLFGNILRKTITYFRLSYHYYVLKK